MTRLPVVGHLSHDEIDRRYRACADAAEKTRWHVLWLVTRPEEPLAAAAARLVGFAPAWGRAILERHNAHGPDALADGRRGPGAAPELTTEQQAELFAAPQAEPPGGGFAHPKGGRSRFLIRPKANAECMGHALADFAGWADPEGCKVLVAIADGSGGHTAKKLAVPPNVVSHRPPGRTPELQPAEHLWPLVREGVADRVFDTLPKLAGVLTTRCQWLTDHPTVAAGAVGLHWAVAA